MIPVLLAGKHQNYMDSVAGSWKSHAEFDNSSIAGQEGRHLFSDTSACLPTQDLDAGIQDLPSPRSAAQNSPFLRHDHTRSPRRTTFPTLCSSRFRRFYPSSTCSYRHAFFSFQHRQARPRGLSDLPTLSHNNLLPRAGSRRSSLHGYSAQHRSRLTFTAISLGASRIFFGSLSHSIRAV